MRSAVLRWLFCLLCCTPCALQTFGMNQAKQVHAALQGRSNADLMADRAYADSYRNFMKFAMNNEKTPGGDAQAKVHGTGTYSSTQYIMMLREAAKSNDTESWCVATDLNCPCSCERCCCCRPHHNHCATVPYNHQHLQCCCCIHLPAQQQLVHTAAHT